VLPISTVVRTVRRLGGVIALASCLATPALAVSVDDLGVTVKGAPGREFSYTDKVSGYFYGRTNADDDAAYFLGWNIATKRVLHDYALTLDGAPLSRADASVAVYPHQLVRQYQKLRETVALYDGHAVIGLALSDIHGTTIGWQAVGDLAPVLSRDASGLWLAPQEVPGARILVAPWQPVAFHVDGARLVAGRQAGGFVLVYGQNEAEAKALLAQFRREHRQWSAARSARMNHLLAGAAPSTNALQTDRALAWLILTGDSLVMRQMGVGIYAGLPWFNDYWGRDTFISLPGLLLATGQFESAREVLRSFAALQDVDPASPTFGRVPNRARPDGLIYNTADGTPRFVMALYQYAQYSGDTELLKELYPAVQRSIAGTLKNATDPNGYLIHDDADTWMDARRQGKEALSPRGNRANDVQWLWYEQLRESAAIAERNGDDASAARWRALAANVKTHFRSDFVDAGSAAIADHLTAGGEPNFQVRPNQLFALDLVDDNAIKRAIVRRLWQQIVYPWGVTSLSQDDPNFHPYHEAWRYYHKDEAYHNGAIWLWLNGIAMQRMVEQGQADIAWQLFDRTSAQALTRGVVGGLSENADALPRDGAAQPRLSGAFLQAWSNAEQIRVWSQEFLGVRPQMLDHRVTIRPALPAAITEVHQTIGVGAGRLHYVYSRKRKQFEFSLQGISTELHVALSGYQEIVRQVSAGQTLRIAVKGDGLVVDVVPAHGRGDHGIVAADPGGRAEQAERDRYFTGTTFTTPVLAPNLKSLSVAHDPPIQP
jgi:glycogen debranching enzyme